jgi:hypothetical protein
MARGFYGSVKQIVRLWAAMLFSKSGTFAAGDPNV